MNGLSSKNSTAFTSSSILAVVSAMNALSAECMGARILSVNPALRPGVKIRIRTHRGNHGLEIRLARRGDRVCADRRRSAVLSLRGHRQKEILRLDAAAPVRRPVDRGDERAGTGDQARRPRRRGEGTQGEGSGCREEARGGGAGEGG